MPTRYLKQKKTKNGTYWTLTPPVDYRRACGARAQSFDDGRTARAAALDLEKKVKAFRKGQLEGFHLNEESNVYQLRAAWLRQDSMKHISDKTLRSYTKMSETICDTRFRGKTVGELKVKAFNHRMGSDIFSLWSGKRPHTVSKLKLVFNMMFKFAVSQDLTHCVPMQYVSAKIPEVKQIIWTNKQVDQVVKECMSSFETRNLGLLVIMCYEWAQRAIDIRHLKWDNVDFETDTVTIKQTKRGAEVYLPMDASLKALLLKQKEDFGFQPFVVPYHRSDNSWVMYPMAVYNKQIEEIKKRLGLPAELKVGHLRKTAVTEMVEAGLTEINIKPVTGHKNLSSITPYVKHTRTAAAKALHARRESKE